MSFSILIVDDEPDIADLFRQCFRREMRRGKYVLHFAASGEEALRRFAEIHPELIMILSDINMPRNRWDRVVAGNQASATDAAVLMVTAYGDDERKRRAGELGAAAFLAKPVDFNALKKQVLQLMPGSPGK